MPAGKNLPGEAGKKPASSFSFMCFLIAIPKSRTPANEFRMYLSNHHSV